MKKFNALGTLTLNVSMDVLANDHEEAMAKLYSLISELNLHITETKVQTLDGTEHKLDVHDYYIEWEDVEEVYE